jgi:hypothetical protein
MKKTEREKVAALLTKQPVDAKELKRLWAKYCPDTPLIKLAAGEAVFQIGDSYGVNQDGRLNAFAHMMVGGPRTEDLEKVIKAIVKQKPQNAISAAYHDNPMRIPLDKNYKRFFFSFGVCWISFHPDYDKDITHYSMQEWQAVLSKNKSWFDRIMSSVFDW